MAGALKVRTSVSPDVWTTIGGGSFATDAETVAGVVDNKAVTPAGLNAALDGALPAVNVQRDFGAVGDGVADDSAAIQAAINYCLGGTPEEGATVNRIARARLYLPPGTYKTTVAPRVISTSGFEMFGTSPYASTIKVSGARTFGIELDGLRSCYIHDLRINGTHGVGSTDTVRDALALNWTTIANRSTSHVVIERILVHELKYTNGITVGFDSPTRQVDDIWIYNCTVNGQWTVGETTWWQTGFQSGNGTHGNVLNHNYHSCASAINRYSCYANCVNVTWIGGDVGHAEVDFRHNGSSTLAVNGLRSEVSQRLYESNGGASFASSASISNILFSCTGIAADGQFIRINYGGSYFLQNVILDANAATPKINIANAAGKPTYVTTTGLQTRSTIDSLYTVAGTAPAVVTSLSYCQINSSGQPEVPVGNGLVVKTFNGGGGIVEIGGIAPSITGRTGEYWGIPVTKATGALVIGTLYTFAVYVPFTRTIDRIGAEITTAAASSTITLGIYEDDGTGLPGALLLDAGTISGIAIAAVELTISQPLQGGKLYHFAALCQGGTPTVRTVVGTWQGNNTSLANALGSSAFRGGRNRGGISGTALPTPAAITGLSSTSPSIAVRLT